MKTFREIVGEAIGEASMCWSETPKGIFDSDRAVKIIDRIIESVSRETQLEVLVRGHMDAMKPLLDEWSEIQKSKEDK